MYRVVEGLLTLGNIGNYDIFAVFFSRCELNDNDDVRNNSSKNLQIQSIFVLVACYEMLVDFEVLCIMENAERTRKHSNGMHTASLPTAHALVAFRYQHHRMVGGGGRGESSSEQG